MYQEAIDLLVKLTREHGIISITIYDNGEIATLTKHGGEYKIFDSALDMLKYFENKK